MVIIKCYITKLQAGGVIEIVFIPDFQGRREPRHSLAACYSRRPVLLYPTMKVICHDEEAQ